MKDSPLMEVEREAADRMQALLAAVPFLSVEGIDRTFVELDPHNRMEIDFLLHVKAHGRSHRLVCEVKRNGQPRHVRDAINQLRHFLQQRRRGTYMVVIAPVISPFSNYQGIYGKALKIMLDFVKPQGIRE